LLVRQAHDSDGKAVFIYVVLLQLYIRVELRAIYNILFLKLGGHRGDLSGHELAFKFFKPRVTFELLAG